MKDVLGNHFKDLLFHLVHWLSITLSLRRISHESIINLERKFYLDCSSDTLCTRGERPSVLRVVARALCGGGSVVVVCDKSFSSWRNSRSFDCSSQLPI